MMALPARSGMPDRPSAPPNRSTLRYTARSTSPSPMVAMARYTPDSRSVGTPMIKANTTGVTADSGSTAQNGHPSDSVINADE